MVLNAVATILFEYTILYSNKIDDTWELIWKNVQTWEKEKKYT